MSEVAVVPGCIFHWKEYVFADGAKANKYFIIVGAKKDCNFLTVIATSQPKHRKYEPGCNHKQGYYHIPGGRKDWFPLDTWLLLAEPVEVVPEEFLADQNIKYQGSLRAEIGNAIRNCLKRCDDVSEAHVALL
jgi:hypothetical protein